MDDLPESELSDLKPLRKKGDEEFTYKGQPAGPTLINFWQWAASDLVNNATRGILAEFIVATSLGLADGVRVEWDAYDLRTPVGTKIEVKSAAYVQSWFQRKRSSIIFSTRPTRAWDAQENRFASEIKRQADIYVFALLAHPEKATVQPLDLDQWKFYPVLTRDLNASPVAFRSLTLKRLQTYCTEYVSYGELSGAVMRLEALLTPQAEKGRN